MSACLLLAAQQQPVKTTAAAQPSTAQSALIAVSLAMNQASFSVGQKLLVILSERNISNRVLYESNDFNYRIHVQGEKGEPPKTYYHRQLRGEPGVPALLGGLVVPWEGKKPGESIVKKFDLTVFYDLSQPGKYTAYLEVRDEAGVWLRTNSVQFSVLPQSAQPHQP
jgi:hypothetical protein